MKNIEIIKNILIVVLFSTTVLLLCFFLKNDSFDLFKIPIDIISPEAEAKVPKVSDVMQPEQIVVGFGKTGSYTVLSNTDNRYWDRAVIELGQLGNSENLLVEEITADQYRQVIELRSIQFQFDYDIPFGDFLSFYGIKRFQTLEGIGGMGTLAYSEGSEESRLFIYEQGKNKYYRIVSDKESFDDFGAMIDEIEATPYEVYYPSSKYFGVETEKMVYMPLSLQRNLVNIPFKAEIEDGSKGSILNLAESFFGESFDFVRRMTDNKNRLIYMYGYGQKVFTVNGNGIFEYKEELDDSSTTQLGFYDSLQAALRFVSVHGTWESLDGSKLSPYLKSSKPIERDRRKGYRFIFGMKLDGYEVQYQDGEAVQIDIYGGQVVSYKRNMLNFNPSDINHGETSQAVEVFPAVNVAAMNYEYIWTLYNEVQKKELEVLGGKPQDFESLAAEITDMKIGYVRPQETEDLFLIPAWIIDMKGIQIYFDLFTVEPIGYTHTD